MSKDKLIVSPVVFGADPEVFLTTSKGKVVGAEKVLPEAGLKPQFYAKPSIVIDGVQAELNPAPSGCRQGFGFHIREAFRTLRDHLKTSKDISASFASVVSIDKKELDSLSDKAKVFGCAPSLNAYDKGASIKVHGETYLKRSAGGHIHLGFNQYNPSMMKERVRLVPLLDVIVGNTCVLMDRDPDAAERRQVYGRAGEYRLPAYGIEYRTLSNFWLRSYPLMSLVMGLGRMAVSVLGTTIAKRAQAYEVQKSWDAESTLLKHVDLEKVIRAINRNDLKLAQENFKEVKGFIRDHVEVNNMGLHPTTLRQFDYFCQKIRVKGLEYWFPADPITHWTRVQTDHGGAEGFLAGIGRRKEWKTKSLRRR